MIIAINKPKGPTSNRVLSEIKKISGIKKIGHAGTLDPLASGVLVVAITRLSTRKLTDEVKKEKEYKATIKLGMYSTTDDEEGEKTVISLDKIPTREVVNKALEEFIGLIDQIPPIYSAIKINGREAYKYARIGQEVIMQPRKAEIKNIEVLDFDYPLLTLNVVTGPGVYIRTLARDIGTKLGTGGYLADLVRTRVGEFTLKQAKSIEDLKPEDFEHLKVPNK